MANDLRIQTIIDGARNAVMKVTGVLDSSNQGLIVAINVSTLTQGGSASPPKAVRIDRIQYSISDQLTIQMYWEATANVPVLDLAGRGKIKACDYGGLQNNAGAGKTGNILLQTSGWASGIQVYTVVLEMVKQ